MKFLSIKNIFEFKDNHIDGVRNNLLKNLGNQNLDFKINFRGWDCQMFVL